MAPGGADGVGVGNIMIKRERVLLNINYCSTKLMSASFYWSRRPSRLSSSPISCRGNSFRKTAKHGYNSESFNISYNSNEMMEETTLSSKLINMKILKGV